MSQIKRSQIKKIMEKVQIGKINDDWRLTAHFWAAYAQDLRDHMKEMMDLVKMLTDEERILPPNWVED